MRATLAIGVLTLAGCSFHPNGAKPGDGSNGSDDAAPGSDAHVDDAAPPDTPNSGFCTGNLIRVCVPDMPVDVSLTGQLDTTPGTGDSRCLDFPQLQGPHVCVISGKKVTIDNLQVSGSRPLVVAAFTDIEIPHKIDVASHSATSDDPLRLGPGADDDDACDGGTAPVAGASGGGGGAGGSYGTPGGDGGTGVSGTSGAGTTPNGDGSPLIVRGGCKGGKGAGNLAFMASGGDPGHGGGALLLSANNTIHLGGAAVITAGGSGGSIPVATSGGGGGGGGTGGWIGFDATTTTIDGNAGVFANGGGGATGDGGASSAGVVPIAGEDGHSDQNAALGGQAPAGFGGGGNGSALAAALSGQPAAAAGGGGGGGGAGMIVLVHGTITGGHLSPTISQ